MSRKRSSAARGARRSLTPRRSRSADPLPRGDYPAIRPSPGATSGSSGPKRDLHALLAPLFELNRRIEELRAEVAGYFSSWGWQYEIDRFCFEGPCAGREPIRLGLFAGLHGDEPAGCAALVELLVALAENPQLGADYHLSVYPVCNPTGYEDATRVNRAGKDLNREFWHHSAEPEVRILEHQLEEREFDGIITLHSDDTCEGVYGYAHGRLLNEALLEPALRAAAPILPRDSRMEIDGFAACDGVLHDCFHGVLSPPAGQERHPFDLIFETPAHAPLDLQVRASVAALEAILKNYRGFIAYAQDL